MVTGSQVPRCVHIDGSAIPIECTCNDIVVRHLRHRVAAAAGIVTSRLLLVADRRILQDHEAIATLHRRKIFGIVDRRKRPPDVNDFAHKRRNALRSSSLPNLLAAPSVATPLAARRLGDCVQVGDASPALSEGRRSSSPVSAGYASGVITQNAARHRLSATSGMTKQAAAEVSSSPPVTGRPRPPTALQLRATAIDARQAPTPKRCSTWTPGRRPRTAPTARNLEGAFIASLHRSGCRLGTPGARLRSDSDSPDPPGALIFPEEVRIQRAQALRAGGSRRL